MKNLSNCILNFQEIFLVKFRYSRESLKVLGTVGEPINPEAWLWYYHTVGDEKCVIVDTYWQTETVSTSYILSNVFIFSCHN